MPDDTPGWRQDPTNALQQRWYDGFKWTSSVRPLPTPGALVDDTPPSRPAATPPPVAPTPRAASLATTYPTGPANAHPTPPPSNYRPPMGRVGAYGVGRGKVIAIAAVVGLALVGTIAALILPAVLGTAKSSVAISQTTALAKHAVTIAADQERAVTQADLGTAIAETTDQASIVSDSGTDASGGLSAVLAIIVKGNAVCVGINFSSVLSVAPVSTGTVACSAGTAPTTLPAGYTPLQMVEQQYFQDTEPYVQAATAFAKGALAWGSDPTQTARLQTATPFIDAISSLQFNLVTQAWPASARTDVHSFYMALGPFRKDLVSLPRLSSTSTSAVASWDMRIKKDGVAVNRTTRSVLKDLGIPTNPQS